jgi:hypothetical protein
VGRRGRGGGVRSESRKKNIVLFVTAVTFATSPNEGRRSRGRRSDVKFIARGDGPSEGEVGGRNCVWFTRAFHLSIQFYTLLHVYL